MFYLFIYISIYKRDHVFALYTNNNAYTIQAHTKTDMIDWISKIDQKFPIDNITDS